MDQIENLIPPKCFHEESGTTSVIESTFNVGHEF